MVNKDLISEAQNADIIHLWERLGFPPPKRRGDPVCSPFRADHKPSCQLGGAKNIFTDYAADETLDTIELVRRASKMSFAEAVEFITGRAPHLPPGGEVTPVQPAPPASPDPEAIRRHQHAARLAKAAWAGLPSADPTHPYLARKAIEPHGAREITESNLLDLVTSWGKLAESSGPWLALPLVTLTRSWRGLQFISPSGCKLLLPGTRKHSACIPVRWLPAPRDVIIAEGYATAASLAQAEPESAVLAALDAGNLIHVARAARSAWPDVTIIIGGDNDANGVGQKAALDAAEAISGKVSIPQHPGTDWNDVLSGKRQDGPQPDTAKAQVSDGPPPDPALVARRVMDQLRALPGSDAVAIATATGFPLGAVNHAIARLAHDGRILVSRGDCFPVNKRRLPAVAGDSHQPPAPPITSYHPSVIAWRHHRQGTRLIWLAILRDLLAAMPQRGSAWLAWDEAATQHGCDDGHDLLEALGQHVAPFGGWQAHPATKRLSNALRHDLEAAANTVTVEMVKIAGRELKQ